MSLQELLDDHPARRIPRYPDVILHDCLALVTSWSPHLGFQLDPRSNHILQSLLGKLILWGHQYQLNQCLIHIHIRKLTAIMDVNTIRILKYSSQK